jgi:hypothetical protein
MGSDGRKGCNKKAYQLFGGLVGCSKFCSNFFVLLVHFCNSGVSPDKFHGDIDWDKVFGKVRTLFELWKPLQDPEMR